jgi:hypothetical protein
MPRDRRPRAGGCRAGPPGLPVGYGPYGPACATWPAGQVPATGVCCRVGVTL